MTMFHGGKKFTAHSGLCLCDEDYIAARYASGRGDKVVAVEIDLDGLVDREVEVTDRDNIRYPGDTEAERAALIADGVDYITYADEDPNGGQHTTVRLIS